MKLSQKIGTIVFLIVMLLNFTYPNPVIVNHINEFGFD